MFLFTTPSAGSQDAAQAAAAASAAKASAAGSGKTSGASAGVVEAIRQGAQSSGVGFDYLLATAQRESSLDPTAKAATSSATGLFQFIEQTWLGTMKSAGPSLGLSSYADAITAKPDGTFAVSDAAAKQAILDLRRDPKVSAALAGALTQRNRESLTGSLGREPTSGDLYAAHVLGAKGAATLISSAQGSPARAAALDLPDAAAANRSLFYDRTGRARGSAELYAHLSAASAARTNAPASDVTAIPEGATSYASLGGDMSTLFQTDRRQGAVSDGVARLWQGRTTAQAARAAPTYFPRSDAAAATTEDASAAPVLDAPSTGSIATPATGPALVGAPLPPRRPVEWSAGQAAATRVAAGPARAPLDLSLFTIRSGP